MTCQQCAGRTWWYKYSSRAYRDLPNFSQFLLLKRVEIVACICSIHFPRAAFAQQQRRHQTAGLPLKPFSNWICNEPLEKFLYNYGLGKKRLILDTTTTKNKCKNQLTGKLHSRSKSIHEKVFLEHSTEIETFYYMNTTLKQKIAASNVDNFRTMTSLYTNGTLKWELIC